MTEFLRAVRDNGAEDLTRRFFPTSGIWTYTNTIYLKDGGVLLNRWEIPSAETAVLLSLKEAPPVDPVLESFQMRPEGQKLGMLIDIVGRSGDQWRLVGGNRFVPPSLIASSPIYVEWRKEGDRWVINAYGDAWFDPAHLPSWY